jgi:hypothetical protein
MQNSRVVGGVCVSYGGVRGLESVIGVCVCPIITLRGVWAKLGFGIAKLGAVYPCSNMLVAVCCGLSKEVEPSMVVRL